MYFLTVVSDRCPVCFMMANSLGAIHGGLGGQTRAQTVAGVLRGYKASPPGGALHQIGDRIRVQRLAAHQRRIGRWHETPAQR